MSDLFPFPHCGRPGCRCTHTAPCVAGWIETTLDAGGRETEAAKPCPTCRGDRLSTDEEIADGESGRVRWFHRLRANNARAARNKSEDDW